MSYQRPTPDTLPHDDPRGRCRPSCCKNPYFCRTKYRCACHQGALVADRVPAMTILALDRRDALRGRACVMSGSQSDRIVPQHRQGGMGGRKNKHRLTNVLWLDSILNGWIESDAGWAAQAQAWGVKVPVWVDDERRVPVYFANEGRWYRLCGESRDEITAATAIDMMIDVYGEAEYFRLKALADDTARARLLSTRAVG